MNYRFVIVGAGVSGLYAAYQLLLSGVPNKDIVILEKGLNCGARVHSVNTPAGRLNMGAGRFNTQAHPLLYALMKNFNQPVVPHVVYNPNTPAWMGHNQITQLARKISSPKQSFVSCVQENLSKQHLEHLYYSGFKSLLKPNMPAHEAIRIIFEHPEFALDENSEWVEPKNSFGGLIDALTQAIDGVQIQFGAKVLSVKTSLVGHQVLFKAYMEDNASHMIEAKHVIVASPDISFLSTGYPDLVDAIECASEPVPLFKCFFHFDTPWWQAHIKERNARDIYLSTNNPEISKVYFNKAKNIAWIYNDGPTAIHSNQIVQKGNYVETFLQNIAAALKIDSHQVPKPNMHVYKFWPQGVYFWRSMGLENQVLSLLQTLSKHEKIHLVSSRFASRSGWIEGALENVVLMLNNMVESKMIVSNKAFIVNQSNKGVNYVNSSY